MNAASATAEGRCSTDAAAPGTSSRRASAQMQATGVSTDAYKPGSAGSLLQRWSSHPKWGPARNMARAGSRLRSGARNTDRRSSSHRPRPWPLGPNPGPRSERPATRRRRSTPSGPRRGCPWRTVRKRACRECGTGRVTRQGGRPDPVNAHAAWTPTSRPRTLNVGVGGARDPHQAEVGKPSLPPAADRRRAELDTMPVTEWRAPGPAKTTRELYLHVESATSPRTECEADTERDDPDRPLEFTEHDGFRGAEPSMRSMVGMDGSGRSRGCCGLDQPPQWG